MTYGGWGRVHVEGTGHPRDLEIRSVEDWLPARVWIFDICGEPWLLGDVALWGFFGAVQLLAAAFRRLPLA